MDRDQSWPSGHIKQGVQIKISSYGDDRASSPGRGSLCKLPVAKISAINLDA